MTETLPTIDFSRIRTFDGTQSGGFEQLAVELFAREIKLSRRLVRVNGAGGDGGVEAYVEIMGKGTLGMQAKYFEQFGDVQWKQIDKSVRTALTQHPDLKEYRVYVSLDRTKGRLNETEGQVEKWNQRVAAWHKLTNGVDVEFIWQGRCEIELALKGTKNHDLLFYWFGTPQFDDSRMDRQLQSSLQTLGERYQPDRHVNANVGRELNRFVWSPSFERAAEEAFVTLAEACPDFTQALRNLPLATEHEDHRAVVIEAIDAVIRNEYPVYGLRRVDQVSSPANSLSRAVEQLTSYAHKHPAATGAKRDERLASHLHDVTAFARNVDEWVGFLNGCADIDYQCVLVRGDAGSGKSHLLAHCAKQARLHNQSALLVLGEQFLGDRPPLIQLCEQIGWDGGPTSLLSALNVAGLLAQRPALLLIDALNEAEERRLWKSHLHSLATEVRQYPHVRLVVSCRSDFVGITMPDDFKVGVPDGWSVIEHRGFGDVLAEAVARYFKSYNIQSPHFPPLLDEFRNPLFLDTFCRAFENQTLPNGPITLQTVMERRIARLAAKLQGDIDCDEHHLRQAILALAEKIRGNGGSAVEETVARAAIEPHSPSNESSRSLYTHLVSNGVIVKRIERPRKENSPVVVRFGFERFSDYFIAQSLLSEVADIAALRDLIQKNGRLSWIRESNTYYRNRGIARALAVVVPEQYGIELVDILPEVKHREDILADLLDSLPWRCGDSISASTEKLMIEASRHVDNSSFIEVLLRMSTIPDHPFNARFLHGQLSAMSLPDRDLIWTIPVSELAAESDTVPSTLVDWAIKVPFQLVSHDQARLVATVLLWFGSSNRVAFRSRAGLAAIRILSGRPDVARDLVENFDAANDPYVVERLYAVACGVAMRNPSDDGLRSLAATVHRLVFATGDVRPHLLLRDYAQTLLETAAHQSCIETTIDSQSFRPSFVSTMPAVMEEAEVKQIEDDRKWARIVDSVKPESMGMYGDFGRYVMGYAVHHFLATNKQYAIPQEPFSNCFDTKLARRWVLQRVRALGWTTEHFGEYDRHRHDNRMTDDEHKVERIGKKYQRIALHELLGYLSDHHHMQPHWGGEPQVYEGAWQVGQRDFDPSAEPCEQPNTFDDGNKEPSAHIQSSLDQFTYPEPYPDPFTDLKLLGDRAAWVISRPDDPIRLLTATCVDDSSQWLTLDGYWRWNEPRILRLRHRWDGRCKMWIHTRAWLVKTQDRQGFVDRIRQLNFWGHGIQNHSLGDGWIGEYPHGAAFAELRQWCEQPDALTKNDNSRHVRTTCRWTGREDTTVPSPQLCDVLGVRWSGKGATFCDRNGNTIVAGAPLPLPNTGENATCVVHTDSLRAGLIRAGLDIVWAVVGERTCWNGEKHVGNVENQFNGVYTLTEKGIVGGLTVIKKIQLPVRN